MDADDLDRLAAMDRSAAVKRIDRKIAGERRGFQGHLAAYVFVVALMWAIYLTFQHSAGDPWPLYATLGWGFGLAGHFFGVRAKLRELEETRDDVLLATGAPRQPQVALPPAETETDDTLARAEALLRRERTR